MSRPTRWAVAALLFLAPLAGLTYAYPHWPADAGLDLWAMPSLQAEIAQRQQLSTELDARLRATDHRMACKSEIALDLIDARLTLREAIVAFRNLNADNVHFVRVMRYRYPDAAEDELNARNVLDTVVGHLDFNPRRAEIIARLDSDFEAIFSHPSHRRGEG